MTTKAEQLGQKFRRDAASAMASASVIDYLRMMQEQSRIRRRHERMVDVRQKCQYPDYEPYDENNEGGDMGGIWYNNVICTDADAFTAMMSEDDSDEPKRPQQEQPQQRPQPRPQPNRLPRILGPLAVSAGLAVGGGLIGYGLTQIPSGEDTNTDTVTVIGIE